MAAMKKAAILAGVGVFGAFAVNPLLAGLTSLRVIGIDLGTAVTISTFVSAMVLPMAAIGFIRTGGYAMRPALGLTLGGAAGVFGTYTFLRNFGTDYDWLQLARWAVVFVALVGAFLFLKPERKPGL